MRNAPGGALTKPSKIIHQTWTAAEGAALVAVWTFAYALIFVLFCMEEGVL